MKILGKTENGYLLEAAGDELANLIGYRKNVIAGKGTTRVKIGDEIKVSDMFKQLYVLGEKKDELAVLADRLNKYAEELILIDPLVVNIPIEKAD